MLTKSLQLDNDSWDILLDGAGNLAITSDKQAVAQDVATACLSHLGEVWFDTTLGIPWLSEIVGKNSSVSYIQNQMEEEALRLPYVAQALATVIFDREKRKASGLITVIDTQGRESRILL